MTIPLVDTIVGFIQSVVTPGKQFIESNFPQFADLIFIGIGVAIAMYIVRNIRSLIIVSVVISIITSLAIILI